LSIDNAADLLDLERFAAGAPSRRRSPDRLYRDAVADWKAGRSREAMAAFLELRARVADPRADGDRAERQRAGLALAVAAGSLGKERLAHQLVEELLLEGPVVELTVAVLVQAAVCWSRLGGHEAALAFVDRAATHVAEDDPRSRGWVLHVRASALLSMGRLDEAERAADGALAAYREAGDDYGEGGAQATRIRLARLRGEHEEALRLAVAAAERAATSGHERLRLLRRIDAGNAAVDAGRPEAGLADLELALAEALTAGDRVARFHAHHGLWRAHLAAGERQRADVELRAARYYARFVDHATPEADEVRAAMPRPPAEAGGREAGS